MADPPTPADEALLDRFQRAAFDYFLQQSNPRNGLVPDTSRAGSPASIAVVGFALSCYPVAVERGWMSRADAAARAAATLRFFRSSPQGAQPDATGYKGFYYHFLDMATGARAWQSELSLIDTTLLLAGTLVAGTYFSAGDAVEGEIRDHADAIYRRVDWQWARGGAMTARQGWKPESGFLHYGWDGYDEAAILYVLGLASPTHPLPAGSYIRWTETYQWENIYDREFLYAGPLFIHQFSHAWIDFAGIRDRFMREKGSDYFENTRRAILVQREYARRNPHGFTGYGRDCWGITANEGPVPATLKVDGRAYQLLGYAARGAPYGPDDGTIGPCATLASLPFAPGLVLSAVHHFCARYPDMIQGSRLPSGFNPTVPGGSPSGWVSTADFGLDQGIVVLMTENYRSQLVWNLMRQCPYIATGLRRAGFARGQKRRQSPKPNPSRNRVPNPNLKPRPRRSLRLSQSLARSRQRSLTPKPRPSLSPSQRAEAHAKPKPQAASRKPISASRRCWTDRSVTSSSPASSKTRRMPGVSSLQPSLRLRRPACRRRRLTPNPTPRHSRPRGQRGCRDRVEHPCERISAHPSPYGRCR